MLRQTHVPVHVKLLESIVNDEASSAVNTAKADLAPNSANEALKGVLFAVWSCVLASFQIKRLRVTNLGKKFARCSLARLLARWTHCVKKSQKCVKCAHIVSRRRHYSLAKRIIRRWSGAYFTYSAFLKIRKCRSKRVFNRVCRSIRLVHHWRIWIFVSQRARHYALALVRSAPKNQRQQLIRYWGSVRFCKFPMPSKQCRVDVAGV